MGSIKVRKPVHLNIDGATAGITGKMSMNNVVLQNIIGQGSYAKVYSGTHRTTGNPVAVKVIDTNKSYALRSVATEVSAITTVKHKNIAQLYSHSFSSNKAYLFLEYLPFANVAQLLLKFGPVDENVTRRLISQLFDALKAAHAKGVAHHDIKSENIIVTNDGTLKLIDWGLSINHPNPDIPCSEFSGSPLYLPAEVLNHTPYNPFLADLWAVGVLTYELLTGVVPYDSESYDELVHMVNTQKVVYLDTFSPTLVDFLSGLLSKDPASRFTLEDAINHPWMSQITN